MTESLLLTAKDYMKPSDSTEKSTKQALFSKKKLSNGLVVFDFDLDNIIKKLESFINQLDE